MLSKQLLKYIGIVQWALYNPRVLRGEYAISIPNSIKLVIIADELIDLDNLLVKDILQAMMIDRSQVFCLLTKEASLLPKQVTWPCWILGKPLPISSKKWVIYTVPLEEIYSNPQLKRALWMQICQHESNLEL